VSRTTTSRTRRKGAGRIAHWFGLHSPTALIAGNCWCQRKLPTRNISAALLKNEEAVRAAFDKLIKETPRG
jgi:hypothetical protein